MHSVTVALIVFACSFGGALAGMFVGVRLPPPHLSEPTKHAVKLGMGMIVTLAGLVLGLLVSSAKSAFDTTDNEVKEISAKLVLLDRVLARYGPETMAARTQLRQYVAEKIDQIWPPPGQPRGGAIESKASALLESALDRLDDLSPTTHKQHELKSRALALAGEITQSRWLLIEQNVGSPVPTPFLVIVIFWLTILFVSFGLFAPHNATTLAALVVCAISVATALFLVLELGHPLDGMIEISSASARNALAHLAQ